MKPPPRSIEGGGKRDTSTYILKFFMYILLCATDAKMCSLQFIGLKKIERKLKAFSLTSRKMCPRKKRNMYSRKALVVQWQDGAVELTCVSQGGGNEDLVSI